MRDPERDAHRGRPGAGRKALPCDGKRRRPRHCGHAAQPADTELMSSSGRLPVVLLWHMHQPQYRDALTGQYVLPWTYLHAIKDYTDMAAHLESNPLARAVVNFSPVLIEQIQEIAQRVAAHLRSGAPLP